MNNSLNGNLMFVELNEKEMLLVDGGGLFNEICKDLTAFFVGSSVGAKVGGAIGGSVGGPVGTVVGVVVGATVIYVWDAVTK